MSVDYSGLTRNTWPGTWSPNSTHPIVLDTEIRGTLQSISGSNGDRLTDISGARITEGMLVYIKTGYTAGGYTRTSGNYYKYTLGVGQVRDSNTGAMPNAETNWEVFTVSSGGNVANSYLTSTYVANTTFQSVLANTNAYIATKVNTTTFNSALANTNTNYATKVYVNSAVAAVINAAPLLLNTLNELAAALGNDANFATTISSNLSTKASNTYVKQILANTNSFIKSQLANTNSYIAANALVERQHLANTNLGIDRINTNLTSTNTALRILISDRIQVANVVATYQTKSQARTDLANTNSYIAANSLLERQHLANTNAFIKQQLANTNAYIQSISAGGGSTVSDAPLANGTSLILSNINSQVILKKLKAGRNIEITELNGDLVLTAIEQRDYGYLTGDYGLLSDPAEVDPLFDYGALL